MASVAADIFEVPFADIFAALAAPFGEREIKSRTQSGKQMHYITARTAMNRLDNVLGPSNWSDEYIPSENSVLCRLTIRLPDGQLLTKCDAGGYAGMADSGDDDKSGFSDAFKRAAVKFGVARYLYRDGVPTFVRERYEFIDESGSRSGPDRGQYRDRAQSRTQPRGDPDPTRPSDGEQGKSYGPPKTGRALFAWTKNMEQENQVNLLKYLNGWAKIQEFPMRMVDWDEEQVTLAYAEGIRKLKSVQVSSTNPRGEDAGGRAESRDPFESEGTMEDTRTPTDSLPENRPRTGKAFFKWCKDQDPEGNLGIFPFLVEWGKGHKLPLRVVSWDPESCTKAFVAVLENFDIPAVEDSPSDEGRRNINKEFPQNNSGHGRGQYASKDQVFAYLSDIESFVDRMNQEWLDDNTTQEGLREGIGNILHEHQVTWHLMKWALEHKHLAGLDYTLDPETRKIVPKCSIEQAKQYVAILHNKEKEKGIDFSEMSGSRLWKESHRYFLEQVEEFLKKERKKAGIQSTEDNDACP